MKYATSDGLVTVAAPEGPGWHVDVLESNAEGSRVRAIKCKRTAPGEFFFLMAKDYTVTPQHTVSAELLVRELFPQSYWKMFQQVTIDSVREVELAGRTWWEARYQFQHGRLGTVAKLERVTCVGHHVLVLSGEGAQADVDAHGDAVQAWMSAAEFVTRAAN